jgi:predicted esterase
VNRRARIEEQHIAVRRTARYCTMGPATATDVWFVLHGYAQLARYFVSAFAALDDGTRRIIAPEALNRYYFEAAPGVHGADARVAATWMTREDREHEIDDYVAYLDDLAVHVLSDVVDPKVTVLGFSQGAQTASRWAARGRTRADRLVLWGSGPAHELVPAPALFRGAALTIAIGNADPHISAARVTAESDRLRAAGLQHTVLRYDGGHRIEPDGLLQLTRAGA